MVLFRSHIYIYIYTLIVDCCLSLSHTYMKNTHAHMPSIILFSYLAQMKTSN